MSHDNTPCKCPKCGHEHGIITSTCDVCKKNIEGDYFYLYEQFYEYDNESLACSIPCLTELLLKVKPKSGYHYSLSITEPELLLALGEALRGDG